MAQPGRHRRSGRSQKTNEKSVKNDLTNRLAHKNSDIPGALKELSAVTWSIDRLTVCGNTGSSTKIVSNNGHLPLTDIEKSLVARSTQSDFFTIRVLGGISAAC